MNQRPVVLRVIAIALGASITFPGWIDDAYRFSLPRPGKPDTYRFRLFAGDDLTRVVARAATRVAPHPRTGE